MIENNNQNFTADREGALSNIDGIKVVYLKEYQWISRLQEMMRTLLVLALYIMHFTEAHEEHDNLTNQDLKTLKIEYFLQQFAEQIEKAPKNYIEKASVDKVIEKIKKGKNRYKRKTTNYCLSDITKYQDFPCCVDSVEINFRKIGWNFIIFPKSIKYKFCGGSCNSDYVRPRVFTKAAAQILYVSRKHNLIQRN